MPINAELAGWCHSPQMPTNRPVPSATPIAAKIAEHLLAHARLCRHIAEQCLSDETARELDALANECARAAAEMKPAEHETEVH